MEELQKQFDELDDAQRAVVYENIWKLNGSPMDGDMHYGEHHLFDDAEKLGLAIKYALGDSSSELLAAEPALQASVAADKTKIEEQEDNKEAEEEQEDNTVKEEEEQEDNIVKEAEEDNKETEEQEDNTVKEAEQDNKEREEEQDNKEREEEQDNKEREEEEEQDNKEREEEGEEDNIEKKAEEDNKETEQEQDNEREVQASSNTQTDAPEEEVSTGTVTSQETVNKAETKDTGFDKGDVEPHTSPESELSGVSRKEELEQENLPEETDTVLAGSKEEGGEKQEQEVDSLESEEQTQATAGKEDGSVKERAHDSAARDTSESSVTLTNNISKDAAPDNNPRTSKGEGSNHPAGTPTQEEAAKSEGESDDTDEEMETAAPAGTTAPPFKIGFHAETTFSCPTGRHYTKR